MVFTAILMATQAVFAWHHQRMSEQSETLGTLCWQALVSSWVYLDRLKRRISLPFEFNAFVFFAWPFALPYYLYKSRGGRGFLVAVVFFVLAVIPSVVAAISRLM
jgi:hypothetical protein